MISNYTSSFVLQTCPHHVVAIVTDTGAMAEQVRYSAYGVPFGIPEGDVDSAAFTMDDLDRLVNAEHGTWDTQNGGIDTTAVQQVRGGTGLDGYGSGSYRDPVIRRACDANATGGWAAPDIGSGKRDAC